MVGEEVGGVVEEEVGGEVGGREETDVTGSTVYM